MSGFAPRNLPLLEVEQAGLGFDSWAFDPLNQGSSTAPTAGTIYATAVPYRAGQVVTRTYWWTSIAGDGTTPAHIYTGICDLAGRMLGQSGDDAANTGWRAATKFVPSPLAASLVIPTTQFYYDLFLQVGSWGTTQHTMLRTGSLPGTFPGHIPLLTGGVSQSALPANLAYLTLVTSGSPLRYWSAGL